MTFSLGNFCYTFKKALCGSYWNKIDLSSVFIDGIEDSELKFL